MFKEKRNLYIYMGGRFISLIGTGIQMVALPLYILDLTGSGTLMGVFSLMTMVPALITAPFAGIIGDRRNRRNVMIITDYGRGGLISILGLLAMIGKINIPILFTCQVLVSIMDSIFNSSSGALLPELLSKEDLIKAMSLRGGLDAASMIIGPVLGGMIYGFFGIKFVFYINGISFLISGVASMFISYHSKILVKEKMNKTVFLKETYEVLQFIKNSKGLMQLFTFAMISNFLMAPLFDIVMPYALKKGIGFSPSQYGYIMGAVTVGMLLGNVALGLYLNKFSTEKIMKIGFVFDTTAMIYIGICCTPFVVSALGGASWILFSAISIGCIIMGAFNAMVNTPIGTNLQKMVPNDMRSRFFSVLGMFSQGAIPIGAMIYGALLDVFPYYHIITVVNIINLFVVGVFLLKACKEVYDPVSVEM